MGILADCRLVVTIVLLLSFSSGCGNDVRVPLTSKLIEKYGLTSADFKKLQYYVKGSITLSREVQGEYKVKREGTKLVYRDGKKHETMKIPAGTPATCIGIDDNKGEWRLHVSFQSDTCFFFSRNSADRWVVASYELNGSNTVNFFSMEGGQVRTKGHWGKTPYQVNPKSENAYLLVAEDALSAVEKETKVLKGMKIPKRK